MKTTIIDFKLSANQEQIHNRAVSIVRKYLQLEAELIEALQQVDACKLYRKFDQPSLFQYSVQILGLSEATAYAFISVARKAKECAELQDAIASRKLSVSKAARIVSALKPETASRLIGYAATHSMREIKQEVAKQNPESEHFEKIQFVSETQVQITVTLSRTDFEKLERAQSLEAQRGQLSKMSHAISAALDTYLERRDPVKKAQRRQINSGRPELHGEILKHTNNQIDQEDTKPSNNQINRRDVKQSANAKKPSANETALSRRIPAAIQHAVRLRDQGRCTHIDNKGQRCNQDRWVTTHHIHPLSLGGAHTLENLTTLCSFHHDLVHQLSLPIDGQVSYLRSPQVAYR